MIPLVGIRLRLGEPHQEAQRLLPRTPSGVLLIAPSRNNQSDKHTVAKTVCSTGLSSIWQLRIGNHETIAKLSGKLNWPRRTELYRQINGPVDFIGGRYINERCYGPVLRTISLIGGLSGRIPLLWRCSVLHARFSFIPVLSHRAKAATFCNARWIDSKHNPRTIAGARGFQTLFFVHRMFSAVVSSRAEK
jgi:hypothetical protein